jgi:hypothetical protein
MDPLKWSWEPLGASLTTLWSVGMCCLLYCDGDSVSFQNDTMLESESVTLQVLLDC